MVDERPIQARRARPMTLVNADVHDGAGKLVRSIPPGSATAKAMGAMTWQG